MKTVIALFVIASLLVTLVTFDQYFIAVQDREVKERDFVKYCEPSEESVLILIQNNTHDFDLRTCTWYPSDNGNPGLIESFYTSFVEPFFIDLKEQISPKEFQPHHDTEFQFLLPYAYGWCPEGSLAPGEKCKAPFQSDIGGGAIDLDPDLSPSYAYDFMGGLFYHTILPLTALFLGISALFLIPYFILKRKNIPSRPYLLLILSGLLLYFSIPTLVSILSLVIPYYIAAPEQFRSYSVERLLQSLVYPIILLTPASIILYKSSVIRKLLDKRK